jgi:hypothetical protein
MQQITNATNYDDENATSEDICGFIKVFYSASSFDCKSCMVHFSSLFILKEHNIPMKLWGSGLY